MSASWRGGMMPGRCPEWEDRMVRPIDSSTRRTRRRQVRCMKPRGHDGEHVWRGIPFGRLTADRLDDQGRVRRGA